MKTAAAFILTKITLIVPLKVQKTSFITEGRCIASLQPLPVRSLNDNPLRIKMHHGSTFGTNWAHQERIVNLNKEVDEVGR